MSYASSVAYDRDLFDPSLADPRSDRAQRRSRMSLIVGGGLDAEARKGVSMGFIFGLQVVLLAAVIFFSLGAARVAITAQTVELLRDNASMKASIEQMSNENDSLRIERSSLSSSERILAIATDSYGMHPAIASESLSLPESAAPADAAEAAAPTAEPQSEAQNESQTNLIDSTLTIVAASMD